MPWAPVSLSHLLASVSRSKLKHFAPQVRYLSHSALWYGSIWDSLSLVHHTGTQDPTEACIFPSQLKPLDVLEK